MPGILDFGELDTLILSCLAGCGFGCFCVLGFGLSVGFDDFGWVTGGGFGYADVLGKFGSLSSFLVWGVLSWIFWIWSLLLISAYLIVNLVVLFISGVWALVLSLD